MVKRGANRCKLEDWGAFGANYFVTRVRFVSNVYNYTALFPPWSDVDETRLEVVQVEGLKHTRYELFSYLRSPRMPLRGFLNAPTRHPHFALRPCNHFTGAKSSTLPPRTHPPNNNTVYNCTTLSLKVIATKHGSNRSRLGIEAYTVRNIL